LINAKKVLFCSTTDGYKNHTLLIYRRQRFRNWNFHKKTTPKAVIHILWEYKTQNKNKPSF